MENTYAVILIAVALVLGIFGSIIFIPDAECPECDVCKVCDICEEIPECVKTECEVITCEDTANQLLDNAVTEVLDYLDDEEMLICDEEEYDKDEVTIKKVYDEFGIIYLDDDEYIVFGEVKLNFKQDEEKRCRDTLDFEVFYEEDEKPEVFILA